MTFPRPHLRRLALIVFALSLLAFLTAATLETLHLMRAMDDSTPAATPDHPIPFFKAEADARRYITPDQYTRHRRLLAFTALTGATTFLALLAKNLASRTPSPR